jgi:aminotransferase in exopolysaccharide biosynthesis
MFKETVDFIRKSFNSPESFIPLHEPRFIGNERKYVLDAIDSTFVSSVGAYVDKFEQLITEITGAKYAIATVNGTAALHISLILAGVTADDEVITQPLTFVATSNAVAYIGARSVYVDVNRETLGLCPDKLNSFLEENAEIKDDGKCYNKITGRKIAACIPMHTFGFCAYIDKISEVCKKWEIPVVEDAAESLGSYYKNIHTGRFGLLGSFSFNGNKTVTCGGGGAIITDDENIAKLAKHITTTAKVPHKWEYVHDYVGYNYRMPNLNATIACAQLEQLNSFLSNKRELALMYKNFFSKTGISFVFEQEGTTANYWLNTILLSDREERDEFLSFSNSNKVMTRPAWHLMNKLEMFKHSQTGDLTNAAWLEDRIVNIPSSVRI